MEAKRRRERNGFSLVDLLLIIAAMVGIVIVLLPMLTRSHRHHPGLHCINNLKQIGTAFRLWSLDNSDKLPMQVSITNGGAMELAEGGSVYAAFLVMSNELSTPKILFCPEDQTSVRRIASTFAPTVPPNAKEGVFPFTETNSISYFIGLDATDTKPEIILTGDDHFQVSGTKPKPGLFSLLTNAPVEWRNERHRKEGNIGFADGSVQIYNSHELRKALLKTGMATNRLAMP